MTTLRAMWDRDDKAPSLERENAQLRAALNPFVRLVNDYERRHSEMDHSTMLAVPLGWCLTARAAITSQKPNDAE